MFAATVSGNIDKINSKFGINYSQILAQGATVNDPIGVLFDASMVVPCYNLETYMKQKHNDYLDGLLTITHKTLILASAKAKMDWLKSKGTCGAKSPNNEKIVAMVAKINALKGQLKLDPKLSAIAEDKKKGNTGEKGKKFKNKKDSSNKKCQNKDIVWKKVPPKDGKKKRKEVGKFTFN